jgi:hypothetical protein
MSFVTAHDSIEPGGTLDDTGTTTTYVVPVGVPRPRITATGGSSRDIGDDIGVLDVARDAGGPPTVTPTGT